MRRLITALSLVWLAACRPGAAVDVTLTAPAVTLSSFQLSLAVDDGGAHLLTFDGGVALPTSMRLLVDEGARAHVEAFGVDPTGASRAARTDVALTPGGRSAVTLDLSTPSVCPPGPPAADEQVLYAEALPPQTDDARFHMHAYEQWPDGGHDATIVSTTTSCGGAVAYQVHLENQYAGVGVYANAAGVPMRRISFHFQASADSNWQLYTQYTGMIDGPRRFDAYRANEWTLVELELPDATPVIEASFNYSGSTPITARIDDVRFVPR